MPNPSPLFEGSADTGATDRTQRSSPVNIDQLAADQLLTLDHAAATLVVSRRTLYRMIASGEFPQPVRVGGSRRIVYTELVEFLERAKQRRA